MSQAYLDLVKKIDDFIRKYYLNKVVRGIIWLSGIFLACYLFAIVAEYYGYFTPIVKTILFYSLITIQMSLSWFLVIRHLIRYFQLGNVISHEKASEIIGVHFPQINDKLLNTLQLQKLANESRTDKALIEASINQKIASFQPIPFVAAVRISDNKKYLRYALVPLGMVVILAFAAPSILTDGTERFIHHNTYYQKQAPFEFQIINKNLEATQGDDFVLKVKMAGNQIPQDIYIEDGVNTFKLQKEDIINFNYTFKNLQKSKKFRLTAGEFSSTSYTIAVKNKPVLISYKVNLSYPAYLNKQNEVFENPGDLTVPVGTTIKWDFQTEYVTQLGFVINGKVTSLSNHNNQFTHQNKIFQNANYSFLLKNSSSQKQEVISYKINTIADAFPKIEVNDKADSVNARVIYFIGKADDDYGLSNLTFHYQISKTEDQARKGKRYIAPVAFDRGKVKTNFFYLWDLNSLGIKPGEEISYYFDVADNDGVRGPKHTQSPQRIYRLANKQEAIQNIEVQSSSIKQKTQAAIKLAEKIQQQTKKLSQELLNDKNLGYEEKKEISELLAQQKKLQELIQEIQKDSKQNLFDNQQLQPDEKELIEKQKQIQELFDKVLDDKTKQLLQDLQKLMDQNQKEQTQDQLQKMQGDNKSLQKELDRILELYKKLEVEQKINNNIDQLKDLAKKQDELSKETLNKNADAKDLQEKQKELAQEFTEIKKDLKEAADKNEALDNPEDFQNPAQEQQDIQQDMDEAKENLDQNKKQKASQSQKSAAQKMQQMAKQMEQMMENQESEENQVNAQELRQLLQNLLKSSYDQEKVLLGVKKTDPNDPNFLKLAQQQRDIKDNLKIVEDSLYSLSKRVPQIESAVNKEIQTINQQLAQSLDYLSERNVAEANRNQQYALTAINNLALMLSEALQQLQNAMKNAQGGGKGKPQPGLSKLSEMQKQLNKNMEQAKQQMQQQGLKPGQKGSPQMSEQMAKMAQQQQMIRQALQDINNKSNKDGKGKLGDLEKIIKEMEQTETDLVNKRISQESLIRQQEIQTRLLEAEKAERERDQDNQRESKAAKVFAPNYDLILQEYQKLRSKETEQIKTIPPTLNYFYKSKISEYFKTLNSGK